MYCLKCKQSFVDGSRRFCPTDGSRLVSDTGASGGRKEGGIFANLIPKIEGISDLDETLANYPRFTMTEPNLESESIQTRSDAGMDEVFFELDDIKEDLADESPFPEMQTETPDATLPNTKPVARKVNPFDIPAGHVDLGAADRLQGTVADFDENEPEGFVGQTVKGRYKVTEFLGGDGSGLAYLADDKIVEEKKVLVRVLLDIETDEILHSVLAEERVSLSHFSHPNIARLIDSGQFTDGTAFLISEYIDSLSVADIMSIHGPFNELRAARIIRQAASALSEAHQEGILHRDIRPENLILDNSNGDSEQIKLVNFGASNGEPTPQNIGYKAHEVLGGRISTISSDIFSLAVVAYEMLAGRLPFDGGTAKEIIRSQNAIAEGPSAVRTELPTAVDEVLRKALSFDAVERYPKARDFGDSLYSALAEPTPSAVTHATPASSSTSRTETLKPLVAAAANRTDAVVSDNKMPEAAAPASDQPAWKNRSPEPPQEENSRSKVIALVGILALVAVIAAGWYFVVNNPPPPDVPLQADQAGGPVNSETANSPASANTEMPPQPRNLPQPPNTNFYQNSKQNLKGDLLRNFVGFTMYYPTQWKVNGPQEAEDAGSRGHFLDISRSTDDDGLKEQMLISYYPSKGTFGEDAAKFPQLVKETNETLKKLLPGYQMVSEGEIKLNGDWRAYEIKFQAGGKSGSGDKLVVWGRRLYIPAARPGVRNGFEITMLATSLAGEVRSVDDVGVRGELAAILYSFEPSQNF